MRSSAPPLTPKPLTCARGAAAGPASNSGERDAAVHASDILRRDLLVSSQVVENCAFLAALENAGISSDVATDPDASTSTDLKPPPRRASAHPPGAKDRCGRTRAVAPSFDTADVP